MSPMRKLLRLAFILLLVFSFLPVPLMQATPAFAAAGWTQFSGPLTLGGQKYVLDTTVIKDGPTYKMWYTYVKMSGGVEQLLTSLKTVHANTLISSLQNYQFDTFLSHLADLNPDVPTLRSIFSGISGAIGYATSLDGKTWTVVNPNALQGASGLWTSVGFPSVINDGGTYKMWFTRVETTLTQAQLQTLFTNFGVPANRRTTLDTLLNSTRTVIGYAVSPDAGATWSVTNPTAVVNTGATLGLLNSAAAPTVINDGGTYKMWYTGIKSGFTGTDLDNLLAKIQAGTVQVADLMNIISTTRFVVGYATSPNGANTWSVVNDQVLTGGPSLWQSVMSPCVIKSGGTYEMWYSDGNSNLDAGGLRGVFNAIKGIGIPTLWNSLKTKTFGNFLLDVVAINATDVRNSLTGTSGGIGYAVSTKGTSWSVSNPNELVGSSVTPWSSVAGPSVVKSASASEMWFSRGIDALQWQNVFDRIVGNDLGLGYASLTPEVLPPLPPPGPGTTSVVYYVTASGQFIMDVTAKSDDGAVSLLIPKGTIGKDANGWPLREIQILPASPQPAVPAGQKAIGLIYDFGPAGATFSPPITIVVTYKDAQVPAGTDPKSMSIYWRDSAGNWNKLDSTVDVVAHTITAKVSHFTSFAVIIHTAPASFTTTGLTVTPSEVKVGESATIGIVVTNTGDLSGSVDVTLKVAGAAVETKSVTLAGGATSTVTFTVSKNTAGTYDIAIGTVSGKLVVTEVTPPPPTPKPAAFATSGLTVTPGTVKHGDTATVAVTVSNTGEQQGTYTVTLKVNGATESSQTVTLAGGASQKVTFTFTRSVPGTYTVGVDTLSGSLVVQQTTTPPTTPPVKPTHVNWGLIIGGTVGGIIVIVLAILLVMRLRKK